MSTLSEGDVEVLALLHGASHWPREPQLGGQRVPNRAPNRSPDVPERDSNTTHTGDLGSSLRRFQDVRRRVLAMSCFSSRDSSVGP